MLDEIVEAVISPGFDAAVVPYGIVKSAGLP